MVHGHFQQTKYGKVHDHVPNISSKRSYSANNLYQPLFGKAARAVAPKSLLEEEGLERAVEFDPITMLKVFTLSQRSKKA